MNYSITTVDYSLFLQVEVVGTKNTLVSINFQGQDITEYISQDEKDCLWEDWQFEYQKTFCNSIDFVTGQETHKYVLELPDVGCSVEVQHPTINYNRSAYRNHTEEFYKPDFEILQITCTYNTNIKITDIPINDQENIFQLLSEQLYSD